MIKMNIKALNGFWTKYPLKKESVLKIREVMGRPVFKQMHVTGYYSKTPYFGSLDQDRSSNEVKLTGVDLFPWHKPDHKYVIVLTGSSELIQKRHYQLGRLVKAKFDHVFKLHVSVRFTNENISNKVRQKVSKSRPLVIKLGQEIIHLIKEGS